MKEIATTLLILAVYLPDTVAGQSPAIIIFGPCDFSPFRLFI